MRYFFDIHDGKDMPDHEGYELSGLEEVRREALRTAGEMLRSSGEDFWNHGDWLMNVTDDAGNTVVKLRFSAEQAQAAQTPGGPFAP